MLETARRYMNFSDTIRVIDDATGVAFFRDITKDDIISSGKIVPVGARHFAERARRVQSLTQLFQIKASDPSVAAHLSEELNLKIKRIEELRFLTTGTPSILLQKSLTPTTKRKRE